MIGVSIYVALEYMVFHLLIFTPGTPTNERNGETTASKKRYYIRGRWTKWRGLRTQSRTPDSTEHEQTIDAQREANAGKRFVTTLGILYIP